MPIREAVSKDPDMGREAPINTMPEIPSSTVRPTPKGAVTRARLFNSAETAANPPKRKRRTSGKNSLMAKYGRLSDPRKRLIVASDPLATP